MKLCHLESAVDILGAYMKEEDDFLHSRDGKIIIPVDPKEVDPDDIDRVINETRLYVHHMGGYFFTFAGRHVH